MPKQKAKPKRVRSRKGYVMVEMDEAHREALNWLLEDEAKLHGEKPAAARLVRRMIWQTYVARGGLEEKSGIFS